MVSSSGQISKPLPDGVEPPKASQSQVAVPAQNPDYKQNLATGAWEQQPLKGP